ncbi:O-antigen ligase family protein [Nocardioides hwasunensis]|uniref:O-antigen ligase family protein n=1 Tax=Nocardioides hwasunensis TaxID=397258 RepID=A0ABR8MGN0_9ACTN|nr:O-antigen ligase family protein [Nocardioides hwasunensis]MBD3915230.1 O-antigen ligase family protein [Nocardioides hwasunensis]
MISRRARTAGPTSRASSVPAGSSALRLPAVGFVVLYVVLLLCVPSQLIFRPLGAPGTPANMVGICALAWWVAATVGGTNPVKRFTPTRITVALLTAAVLGSYASGMLQGWYAPPDIRQVTDEFWTLVPPTVTQTTDAMVSAADRGLLSFAGWMGIVLMTAEGLRSWADLEKVVDWLVWVGAFVGAIGILQFATGLNIAVFFDLPGLSANSDFGAVDSRSILNRVSATAVHPIEYGVVLGGILPLAVHRMIRLRCRPLAVLPAVVIFVGCNMSVSRSAVLVIGFAFTMLLIGWPAKWRVRALLLLPVAVVGLRMAVPGLVGTLISLFRNLFDDPSISGRTSDYDVLFDVIGDNPLLGRGLFTFVPRYYRIVDNQYLIFTVELGLIGLLVATTFLVVAFLQANAARRRAFEPASRDLSLAIAASTLGVMVSFATFDALGFPMAAGMMMLLVGLAGACWRLSTTEDPRSPYRPHDHRRAPARPEELVR